MNMWTGGRWRLLSLSFFLLLFLDMRGHRAKFFNSSVRANSPEKLDVSQSKSSKMTYPVPYPLMMKPPKKKKKQKKRMKRTYQTPMVIMAEPEPECGCQCCGIGGLGGMSSMTQLMMAMMTTTAAPTTAATTMAPAEEGDSAADDFVTTWVSVRIRIFTLKRNASFFIDSRLLRLL